jgi:amino acid permease
VFSALLFFRTVFALLSFMSYGATTKEVCTNNLPPATKAIANVLITVKVLLTVPQTTLIISGTLLRIRAHYRPAATPFGPRRAATLRLAVLAIAGCVAVAIPTFAGVMSVLGSVTCPLTAFIMPVAMWTKLHWERTGVARKTAHALICALALLGSFTSLMLLFG